MSTPTDIERRAVQVTKRQQRAAKRAYDDLKGKLRSQLRRQLDEFIKPNERDWIFLLLKGGKLRLFVETTAPEAPPVIDAPAIPDESRTPPSSENPVAKPLLEIVSR